MSASECARPGQQEVVAGTSRWPLERALFALAGSTTLLSPALVLRPPFSLRSAPNSRQEASS